MAENLTGMMFSGTFFIVFFIVVALIAASIIATAAGVLIRGRKSLQDVPDDEQRGIQPNSKPHARAADAHNAAHQQAMNAHNLTQQNVTQQGLNNL